MRWQCPHSMVALLLLISGMPVCRITTHLKPYRSLEALYTSQLWFAFRKHAEDLRNVSTKCLQSTFFICVCVLFLHCALQQVNFNLCVHLGCELQFLVTFCDSFAFLFKINYCFVLVSVPLEDELEAVFPSSSFFSLLIFKVARLVPKWILGASLARKVAIHNCLLLFDFFMAVQHLPIATSTLASNA